MRNILIVAVLSIALACVFALVTFIDVGNMAAILEIVEIIILVSGALLIFLLMSK